MGSARRFKNKYSGPRHPWKAERIKQEKVLLKEYGLKTKRELWKITSKVKEFANQAKRLIALRTAQSEIEGKQLLSKLARLGLMSQDSSLTDVLGLQVTHLLNRRLQTLVLKKGLARTSNQARQFIIHGHIRIGEKKVDAPSYIVPVTEEPQITFVEKSTLANPDHPERSIKQIPKPVQQKVEESKEAIA